MDLRSATERITSEEILLQSTLAVSKLQCFIDFMVKVGRIWKIPNTSDLVLNPFWTIELMSLLVRTNPMKIIGITAGYSKFKKYFKEFGLISSGPLVSIFGKQTSIILEYAERRKFLDILSKMKIITKCKKNNMPEEILKDIRNDSIKEDDFFCILNLNAFRETTINEDEKNYYHEWNEDLPFPVSEKRFEEKWNKSLPRNHFNRVCNHLIRSFPEKEYRYFRGSLKLHYFEVKNHQSKDFLKVRFLNAKVMQFRTNLKNAKDIVKEAIKNAGYNLCLEDRSQ